MSIKNQHEIAKEQNALVYAIGIFIDPIVVILSLFMITYFQNHIIDKPYVILGIVASAFMSPGKLYLQESLLTVFHKTIVSWSIVSIFLFLVGYLTDYIKLFQNDVLLYWIVLAPLNLVTVNWIARYLVEWIYLREENQQTVVIVGYGPVSSRLGRYLTRSRPHGMRFLGYFEDRGIERIKSENSGFGDIDEEYKTCVIGSFSDVAKYCNANAVDQVYICIPISNRPRILTLLNELKDTTASIYFTPDIVMTDAIQGKLNHIDGIPVVALCETPLIGLNAIQKRIIDVVLSLVILLLFSPVLVWAAIKVRQSSPGPIIFTQKRYGLDGKSINLYKFRTMTVTEDGDKGYTQVTQNDARVTPIGDLLRKTSLDEFPQFLNVLQGKMSIVGPRPHVIAVNEAYRKLIPGYMVRHKVKPGITGLAQVNGFRGGDDLKHMQGRVEYDLDYLRRWTIGLDLWIIFKTFILFVFGDKNAF